MTRGSPSCTPASKRSSPPAAGRIDKTDNWGRRRLAYEINRHKEGTYVLELFTGSGAIVGELDRRLKVTDNVLRYLVVRVDEDLRKAERERARRQAKRQQRRSAGEAEPAAQPEAEAAARPEAEPRRSRTRIRQRMRRTARRRRRR